MQELNREANTLGSKSVAGETSRLSMELKVLIEQMREQIEETSSSACSAQSGYHSLNVVLSLQDQNS